MKNNQKDWYIVIGTILFFILVKLTTLTFRFGDENVYFYMSDAILNGFIPHRDFFLADPPVFIYIMAFFKMLFSSHIILFKTLPIFFDSISAILIFLLLKEKNKLAFFAPILYLASFTVISTSDYVTGAEIMIPFVLLAILLDQKGKQFYSGVFWALACLVKLYAGPALLGFLFYKLTNKQYENIKKIIIGGLVTTLIIMLPFFILAPQQTFYNLFIHQMNRPEGINKWNIFTFFVTFEWLLILTAIWSAIKNKNNMFVYPLIFSTIFFLLYKDLYFLYLHILIPFIVILTIYALEFLWNKQKEIVYGFMVIFCIMFLYGSSSYVNIYQKEGIFNNPEEISATLKNTPENFPIYGVQEVAPLVALEANKKIFDNKIDTNTQNFAAKTHDLNKISEDAVNNGIYLIARVGEYPAQNIHDTGFEAYFSKEIFDKYCTMYKSFDRSTPDSSLNKITIYRCKK